MDVVSKFLEGRFESFSKSDFYFTHDFGCNLKDYFLLGLFYNLFGFDFRIGILLVLATNGPFDSFLFLLFLEEL